MRDSATVTNWRGVALVQEKGTHPLHPLSPTLKSPHRGDCSSRDWEPGSATRILAIQPAAYADSQRQRDIEKFGVRFLRFSDEEVKQNLEAVIDAIADWMESQGPSQIKRLDEDKSKR